MPFVEQQFASTVLSAGGATSPSFHNPQTGAPYITAEGISSAASTITLEHSQDAVTWTTIGSASPSAGTFFKINAVSGARHVRLKSSAATTLTNVTISAHD